MNSPINKTADQIRDTKTEGPRLVAVVDIGATSLRMQISEIHLDNQIRKLESFSQAVSIGKNSFIKGIIEKDTIEDCVHVLRIYEEKLKEYGIQSDQLRVVATSAVKEARNRLAFIDRIYVATGFEVELLDEAELHRITFMGALPVVEEIPELVNEATVICEISGGTSEIVIFKDSEVLFSQSFRQGSLRLRKTIEAFTAPTVASKTVLEAQMSRMIGHLKEEAQTHRPKNMIAVGGDIRFAATQLIGQSTLQTPVEIGLNDLRDFVDEILGQSTESLVTKYHLSIPEADTLGPALMAYHLIAKELGIQKLVVVNFNIRDGIIDEFAQGGKWTASVDRETIRSAIQFGRKFNFNETHALYVASLTTFIFDQLKTLHRLDERNRVILEMASLLHEIGIFVSNRSHHKHSMYLIRHAEFFGISNRDLELVALVARYHRRATPQPNHEGYSKLSREGRVTVAKMASILRIAKALDASRNQRIQLVRCESVANRVRIFVSNVADVSLENWELQKAGQMFEDIFGVEIELTLERQESTNA